MKTFQTVCATLLGVVVLGFIALAAGIYTGSYNVAANDHHWRITHWALHKTVQNSVAARADDIKSPVLGGEGQLALGAVHFNENCSGCHTPPGGAESEAAKGMYPAPPDLIMSGEEMPANRIFWTIKNGIKASGMPAWGVTHGDKAMWAMTALIKQFPKMNGGDYQQLLKVAKARGIGHEHSEGEPDHHGSDDEGHDQEHSESSHDHAQTPHAHD